MTPFRQSEPKQAGYAYDAKEFLRRKLIGKHVKVHIDFVRPREGEYEERECATVRYGAQNAFVCSIHMRFGAMTEQTFPQERC